jgi:hypothetical protein
MRHSKKISQTGSSINGMAVFISEDKCRFSLSEEEKENHVPVMLF